MKGKNGVKLADFIREMINTIISEKPVKSRIFEDFEGIKNAPPRLLLRDRCGFDSRREYQIFSFRLESIFVKLISNEFRMSFVFDEAHPKNYYMGIALYEKYYNNAFLF